jgi:parvulin-like peptidyl-prolyl isomerase
MTEGPNLTLPPRDRWVPERPARRGVSPILASVLLAAVLGLQVFLVVRSRSAPDAPPPPKTRSGRPAAELKEVAIQLQRDNLHTAAAEAYEEYLAAAELSDEDRANVLLETGNLLAKAGKYEAALARYFRAKPIISPANDRALKGQILECLQRLGKHAEQGYELRDQVARGAGKTAGDEASKAVAWIGLEKITSSDLDDLIAREIEERVASIPGLPPEKLAELKAQAQKQYQSPQARLAKLREHVARTVLYREGLEKQVDESDRVQRRISDFRRDAVVEETVMSALRDRIKVSEGDLRNYFRVNQGRYRDKAGAKVRIAVLADEAKAREVQAAAKTEDEFARLARERSIDAATREQGGLLDRPVVEGEAIGSLGPAPELTAAIFKTEAGHPTEPVKVATGFALAFVVERIPERAPPYEEVREKVGKDYVQEKEAEVQSQLVKEMFEKHKVSFATDDLAPPPAGEEKQDTASPPPAAPKAPPAPAAAPPGPQAPPPAGAKSTPPLKK